MSNQTWQAMTTWRASAGSKSLLLKICLLTYAFHVLVCGADDTGAAFSPSVDAMQKLNITIEDLDLLARNATNELDLSVEMETLTVVMEKSGMVKVNFTLYCVHPSVRYSLTLSTKNPKVADVDRSVVFNFSCVDATVQNSVPSGPPQGGQPVNAAGETSEYFSPGSESSVRSPAPPVYPYDILLQALPTVQGSFNFTAYGDLIGRTWLQIHGKRGSDPDVVLPVVLKLPWIRESASSHDHLDGNSSEIIFTDSVHSSKDTDDISGKGHLSGPFLVQRYVITVVRMVRPVDIAFRSIMFGFVITATVGMGCKMEISVVKSVLKRPVAPAIGFVCQYLFMPLVAFMLASTLTVGDPAVSLGIFACGICPGGGASNMFTFLLDGDVSLSITMTAISSIGALAMIPLWLFTLGARFQDDKISLKVPFGRIIMTLTILIVPLFIGVLIKYKLPKVAKVIIKFLKPLTLVTIVVLVTFGIYANLYIFRLFAPRTLGAGCLLPYLGYMLGGLTSLILRQPCYRVKTISIETGIQNTGIAYLLLIFSLPTPDGDMAAVGAVASALMTPLPLFALVVVCLLYKRFYKKKDKKGDEEDVDGEKAEGENVALKNSSDKEEQSGSVENGHEKRQKKKHDKDQGKNGKAESEKFLESHSGTDNV